MRWWRRAERERDLDRELRDHQEPEAEEQQAAGLSRDAARFADHRALGILWWRCGTSNYHPSLHFYKSWSRVLVEVREETTIAADHTS
jgi:hypothetical protein